MRNLMGLARLHRYMSIEAMPFPEQSESDMQRVARGLRERDATLIGEVVERYQYRLVRYLLFVTGRRDGIEDLVQETWVRVLARATQYEGRSRFEAWLFSIARNLAIDASRRKQILSLDDSVAPQRSDRSSPFLAAARGEDAIRLAAALELVEPIYREVLLLRFQEDLSLQEIARIVGAPVSTVSSRIHRGLGLLRSRWEGGANAV